MSCFTSWEMFVEKKQIQVNFKINRTDSLKEFVDTESVENAD